MTSLIIPDKIQSLADNIDRLRTAYPSYGIHHQLEKWHNTLKARSNETGWLYDIELVGNISKCPDLSIETITEQVKARPLSTESFVIERIENILVRSSDSNIIVGEIKNWSLD